MPWVNIRSMRHFMLEELPCCVPWIIGFFSSPSWFWGIFTTQKLLAFSKYSCTQATHSDPTWQTNSKSDSLLQPYSTHLSSSSPDHHPFWEQKPAPMPPLSLQLTHQFPSTGKHHVYILTKCSMPLNAMLLLSFQMHNNRQRKFTSCNTKQTLQTSQ